MNSALNLDTEAIGPRASGRPGENIAGFMERRGRRVVEAAGCLWHSVEGRFFMSVPYQQPQDPDADEIRRLLASQHAVGVRFPSVNRPGLASGVYACRRKEYDLSSIHQKQRSQVRRGLENCEVRLVEESELLREGLRLNRDSMARQGRYDAEFGEEKQWRRVARAVYRSRGVAAYGAFCQGRLAAYLIACRDAGWLHILHQNSSTEDLPNNPNHALTFTVTRLAAQDRTLEAVSYGVLSLVAGDGLHLYKIRFAYDLVERTSSFQFHPVLAPLLENAALLKAVRLLRRYKPQDQRLEKVETVLDGARLSAARTTAKGNLAHVADRLG